jgi:serine/threonine-protein kinase
MIAEVVGNYRLLERIGRGGMGEVYLAEHRRMPRRVAIKILLPELSADPTLLDRFFLEARSVAVLEHPGIVKVIDCDVHDGRAFIVMEHLAGEPLSARLRRDGRFSSWLDAVDIGRQIAEAIASAHAKNIVHRDLKPENVFLVRDEAAIRVKILDFGVAKLAVDGATIRTREGALLGTPTYMPPEQCRDPRSVDGRADVYSLGCILFEMLGGRPPFLGRGFGELISQHLSAVPPSIATLNDAVPGALADLVAELLAKEPGARPQSMVEVGARLSMMKVRAALRDTDVKTLILNPEEADALSRPGLAAPTTRGAWTAGTGTLVAPAGEAGLPAQGRRTTTLSQAVGELRDAGMLRRWKLAAPRKSRSGRRFSVPGIGWIAAGAVMAGAVMAILAGARRVPPVRGPVPSAANPGQKTPALSPPADVPAATAPTSPPGISPPVVRDEILVDVTGSPDGLQVVADGHDVSLPLRWPRGSDEHHLLFKAEGYRDTDVIVTADRNRLIALQMQRLWPGPGARSPAGAGGPVTPTGLASVKPRSRPAPPTSLRSPDTARPAATKPSPYDPDGVAKPAWAR